VPFLLQSIMEQLVASGFASTASVIGALNVDESEKVKLCDTILMEHARALAKEGPPGTPAGQAACDKVKSEAQTPAAERDSSPIIATISGECAFPLFFGSTATGTVGSH
jgi:hypothetical protein